MAYQQEHMAWKQRVAIENFTHDMQMKHMIDTQRAAFSTPGDITRGFTMKYAAGCSDPNQMRTKDFVGGKNPNFYVVSAEPIVQEENKRISDTLYSHFVRSPGNTAARRTEAQEILARSHTFDGQRGEQLRDVVQSKPDMAYIPHSKSKGGPLSAHSTTSSKLHHRGLKSGSDLPRKYKRFNEDGKSATKSAVNIHSVPARPMTGLPGRRQLGDNLGGSQRLLNMGKAPGTPGGTFTPQGVKPFLDKKTRVSYNQSQTVKTEIIKALDYLSEDQLENIKEKIEVKKRKRIDESETQSHLNHDNLRKLESIHQEYATEPALSDRYSAQNPNRGRLNPPSVSQISQSIKSSATYISALETQLKEERDARRRLEDELKDIRKFQDELAYLAKDKLDERRSISGKGLGDSQHFPKNHKIQTHRR